LSTKKLGRTSFADAPTMATVLTLFRMPEM
jgi:hypothetical protein